MNRRVVWPLAALAAGAVVAAAMFWHAPKPQKQAEQTPGVRVTTTRVHEQAQPITVEAQGTVKPAREVWISPQVNGQVVAVNPNVVPGGQVAEGDWLFRLDPADYQAAVDSAQAGLAQARAQLAQAQGRRELAEAEWQSFEKAQGEDLEASALALREPQLQQAEAAVEAAKADLARAQLNLSRTEVRAPFAAVVASENVAVGKTLSSQSRAVHLLGSDTLWVEAQIPVEKLPAITIDPANSDSNQGAEAKVRFDLGERTREFSGRVIRLLPDLAPNSRLARVLVAVPSPFAEPAMRERAPLLVDSYVSLTIASEQTLQAVALPRAYLREGDQVWLVEDGQLLVRDVVVGWQREDTVLITEGLGDGDRVITSGLANPVPGLAVRVAEDSPASASPADSTPSPATSTPRPANSVQGNDTPSAQNSTSPKPEPAPPASDVATETDPAREAP